MRIYFCIYINSCVQQYPPPYMRIALVLAPVIIVAGLVLQIYLRVYPYMYKECKWPENAQHKLLAYGDPQITGYLHLQKLRKQIDIKGNDMFLQQIASTTRRILQPDFVAVMGDLLSSQWIDTEEFNKRADRFSQIFPSFDHGEILNVSGNHDIGYHAEFTEERISRFQNRFGHLNFEIDVGDYRLVVINSLSLDGPPSDYVQADTIEFVKSLSGYEKSSVLLTHVPLHKEAGICRDGAYFGYDGNGNLNSQNHLSYESTSLLLDNVFGKNSSGIVLAGHDHEGCLAHYTKTDEKWVSSPGLSGPGVAGDEISIPEATIRSIMGEFGGNTALVSAVPQAEGIKWHFSLCRFHVQHIWWVANVLSIIGGALLPYVLMNIDIR